MSFYENQYINAQGLGNAQGPEGPEGPGNAQYAPQPGHEAQGSYAQAHAQAHAQAQALAQFHAQAGQAQAGQAQAQAQASQAQSHAPVGFGQAEPAQGNMEGGQFFVRTLTGACIAFRYNPAMTILQLKREIQERQQVPVDQQRLVFSGKQLEDDKTLKDYEIGDNAQLHLVLRLRGGF